MNHVFFPTEIIFSATDACNLHCPHCFVSRSPNKLGIQTAQNFLKNCVQSVEKNPELPRIEKIGFSGGEPFLYLDFICELSKTAVSLDLLFDQIMTNGDWWKDEAELGEKLQKLYEAGYDGKIGISYDSFHGQKPERIETFIKNVKEIFGIDSVNIQTVLPPDTTTAETPAAPNPAENPVYYLPQTFSSEDKRAWQSKKWFKEDYCQGPGNILYIHSNGNIAPCCGFANENSKLFIGTIFDDYETIIKKASENKMINICFSEGLSKYRRTVKKQLRQNKQKLPGKCSDICSFCDYICKNF